MATKKSNEIQVVKSITAKAVNGGKEITKKDIGKVIANIGGVVDTYFTHTTQYGEQTGLKGDFIAQNPTSGEIYQAEAIFLPESATKTVIEQLKEGTTEIVLNLSLKVVESSKNSKGIAFIADNPETEARQNRRSALLQNFGSNFNIPQLTA